MTHYSDVTPITVGRPAIGQWLTAAFDAIADLWVAAAARRRERDRINVYLALEDWQLEDMGLTRADVYGALDSLDRSRVAVSLGKARQAAMTRSLRGIRRHI